MYIGIQSISIPNPIMGRRLKARTNRSLLIEIRVYLTGGGAWCGGGGGSLPRLSRCVLLMAPVMQMVSTGAALSYPTEWRFSILRSQH